MIINEVYKALRAIDRSSSVIGFWRVDDKFFTISLDNYYDYIKFSGSKY